MPSKALRPNVRHVFVVMAGFWKNRHQAFVTQRLWIACNQLSECFRGPTGQEVSLLAALDACARGLPPTDCLRCFSKKSKNYSQQRCPNTVHAH